MKTSSVKNLGSALLLFTLAAPASAHTALGTAYSFIDGFTHPWFGIDHLLVMLAVGLWSSAQAGKILGSIPLSFLLMMTAGAGLHFAGFTLLAAEQWVALSVPVFGMIVWRNFHASTAWAIGLLAVFALSHGYVHALEIDAGVDQAGYALGFLLATALLHGLGIVTGLLGVKTVNVVRISFGLVCTVVGVVLLTG
ncbi:MAG: HupE/UreJ family protein [Methylobacter sp.]|jgi:urease accessory protein|uniref:HupE/UreJ family protein n=1 Tax=Methylobacter sp. TaxID=2051955 RepID=UPI0025F1A821|nr:HupE/UreJ family protein [Methylobacter sp.]MCK9622116.1 HupE/UreJ family protein [Methylobacter sp.]